MNQNARTRLTASQQPGVPEVLWLNNGILQIGILPAAGGRILSLQFLGQETLWRNADLLDEVLHPVAGHVIAPHAGTMADWHNYGGDKTWPAPQGWSGPEEWAGPPDQVLDSGVYTWRSVEVGDDGGGQTIELTSGRDPISGLQITRAITLRDGEAAYDLTLTAENTSDRPVTWALWNVTQRRAGDPGSGGVWVGVEDRDLELVELVAGTGVPSATRQSGAAHIPHQEVVGKLGFPTATGWLAHGAHGSTTSQSFQIDSKQTYPDGGSRVEVWIECPLDAPLGHLGGLHPSSHIIEIEVLGPLVRLMPGDHTSIQVRCGSGVGTAPVSAVAKAGHWGLPKSEGEGWAAEFSPYVSGTMELVETGETIAEVVAGSPARVRVPRKATGQAVVVRSAEGIDNWDAGTLGAPAEAREGHG